MTPSKKTLWYKFFIVAYRGYLIFCAFILVLILLARHLLAVPKYALADFKMAMPSIREDWR